MLDEADERWIGEHGYDVDNPLLDEVSRAVLLLQTTPELGVRYLPHTFRREIRRLLLRSGWHVYYWHDTTRSVVVIVAIWFATRGSGPIL